MADADAPVGDLTREPLDFPADRDLRLQNLARADEGFLLALGYSSQRGYGRNHPFAGEIRFGEVEVEFFAEDAGFAVPLGSIALTECQMVNQFKGSATEAPCFTRGYGLAFGDADPVRALEALRRGLVITQDSGNRFLESLLATGLSRLEAEHGDSLAALDHIALAIRNFYESGGVAYVRGPLATLAVFLHGLGRLDHGSIYPYISMS